LNKEKILKATDALEIARGTPKTVRVEGLFIGLHGVW
jgi:hypothetical protein